MKEPAKSPESSSDLQLEIGHVLVVDIVGYSKLLINEQTAAMKTLNQIVRSTSCFRKADATGQLVCLPSGDGMMLVFLDHVEAPANCAVEIARLLQEQAGFGVRMGVHSGPINKVADVNDRPNLAGAGLDMAQRVMDCGDAGHILLSKRVADDLAPYAQWQSRLHDLGEVKVKHDVRLGLVSLFTDEVGNATCPAKVLRHKKKAKFWHRPLFWYGATAAIVLLALAAYFIFRPNDSFPDKSIAVLPFQNLSADQANGYFVQGIEDEILTRLAKIADLKVISRTSTQQYKEKPKNIRVIAKELGVANILEGSVQKVGETARINVQLIRARDDWHRWAEGYDRKLIDVLAVETDVAKRIAEQLRVTLTGSEVKAIELKLTDNAQAYDAYLRGLSLEGHGGFSLETLQAKVKAYGSAVELDPQFAQAWARLSSAHAWLYFAKRTPESLTSAKDALEHAQRLAPNAGEVLMALGNVRYVERDFEGALKAYKETAQALPNNAEVLVRIGSILRRLGHWEEALDFHTRAAQLDPRATSAATDAETWKHLALTLRGLRRYDEAIAAFDRALEAAPNDDADLITEKGFTYMMRGDLDGASRVFDTLPSDADRGQSTPRRLNLWIEQRQFAPAITALRSILGKRAEFSNPEVAETLENLGSVEILNGDHDAGTAHLAEARDLMEEVRRSGNQEPWYAVTFSSEIYSLLGDHAAARREVERALTAYAKDAMLYPQALVPLASVQMRAGETDESIATLTRALQMNCAYGVTPAILRLEPVWDSLRNDPRFQKLTEENR